MVPPRGAASSKTGSAVTTTGVGEVGVAASVAGVGGAGVSGAGDVGAGDGSTESADSLLLLLLPRPNNELSIPTRI
eukprot:6416768-Prymnesium_polylepis.1